MGICFKRTKTNHFVTSEPPSDLQVISLPEEQANKAFIDGQQAQLSCSIQANASPIPSVIWWQLNETISSSQQHQHQLKSSSIRQIDASNVSSAQWLVTLLPTPVPVTTTTLIAVNDSNQSAAAAADDDDNDLETSQISVDQTTELFVSFFASENDAKSYIIKMGKEKLLTFITSTSDDIDFKIRLWKRIDQTNARLESRITSLIKFQVNRQNANSRFICLATNNNLIAPINSTVKLNVYLKPTKVRIVSSQSSDDNLAESSIDNTELESNLNDNNKKARNLTLTAGDAKLVECHVFGSNPTPSIVWLLDNRPLPPARSQNLEPANNEQEDRNWSKSIIVLSEISRDIVGADTLRHRLGSSYYNKELIRVGYLKFIPSFADNGKSLTCSASNSALDNLDHQIKETNEDNKLSDSISLQVLFAPQLHLSFGTNIDPDSVNLNSDVFFDCNVSANPQVNEIYWTHNGKQLNYSLSSIDSNNNNNYNKQSKDMISSSNVIISKNSLVLQRIKLSQRGYYQCQARNSLGSSKSNKLHLRPKFAPICDYDNMKSTKYELNYNAPAKIECKVLAEPSDDLIFEWFFKYPQPNLSLLDTTDHVQGQESIVGDKKSSSYQLVPIKTFETNSTTSLATFKLNSRLEFGQLICRARNAIGAMSESNYCLIDIKASDIPEPVSGCFFDKQTDTSFDIHCQSATEANNNNQQLSHLLEIYIENNNSNNDVDDSSEEVSGDNIDFAPTTINSDNIDENNNNLESINSNLKQHNNQNFSVTSNDNESELSFVNNHKIRKSRQTLVRKLVSQSASFSVDSLKPNSRYTLLIYAQNSKGKSSPVVHKHNTLNHNNKRNLFSDSKQSQLTTTTTTITSANGISNSLHSNGKTNLARQSSFVDKLKIGELFAALDAESGSLRQRLIVLCVVSLLSIASLALLVTVCIAQQRKRRKKRRQVQSENCVARKQNEGSSISTVCGEKLQLNHKNRQAQLKKKNQQNIGMTKKIQELEIVENFEGEDEIDANHIGEYQDENGKIKWKKKIGIDGGRILKFCDVDMKSTNSIRGYTTNNINNQHNFNNCLQSTAYGQQIRAPLASADTCSLSTRADSNATDQTESSSVLMSAAATTFQQQPNLRLQHSPRVQFVSSSLKRDNYVNLKPNSVDNYKSFQKTLDLQQQHQLHDFNDSIYFIKAPNSHCRQMSGSQELQAISFSPTIDLSTQKLKAPVADFRNQQISPASQQVLHLQCTSNTLDILSPKACSPQFMHCIADHHHHHHPNPQQQQQQQEQQHDNLCQLPTHVIYNQNFASCQDDHENDDRNDNEANDCLITSYLPQLDLSTATNFQLQTNKENT